MYWVPPGFVELYKILSVFLNVLITYIVLVQYCRVPYGEGPYGVPGFLLRALGKMVKKILLLSVSNWLGIVKMG